MPSPCDFPAHLPNFLLKCKLARLEVVLEFLIWLANYQINLILPYFFLLNDLNPDDPILVAASTIAQC